MPATRTAFHHPTTPAAKCLHLIRLQEQCVRRDLIAATGLSQPTITRAVTALANSGYIVERGDLSESTGRGRPTMPLELGEPNSLYAGVAVGTLSTYIALFDLKGRTLRSIDVDIPVAHMSPDDFVQHIMAGLHRLSAGMGRPLATVGVTTSGTVNEDGEVTAANLGWHGVPIRQQMREQFGVPVEVVSISQAIVGSEMQSSLDIDTPPVMALFADDSLACAMSTPTGVMAIDVASDHLTTQGLLNAVAQPAMHSLQEVVALAEQQPATRQALDQRARGLGSLVATLADAHTPSTVVVAGSAFIDDPQAPATFARTVASEAERAPKLRMIPSHREIVRDIARAVALDKVLREPLCLV